MNIKEMFDAMKKQSIPQVLRGVLPYLLEDFMDFGVFYTSRELVYESDTNLKPTLYTLFKLCEFVKGDVHHYEQFQEQVADILEELPNIRVYRPHSGVPRRVLIRII